MRHLNAVSIPQPADTLATLTSVVDLLTALANLAGEVRSVFGLSAYLDKKAM